jgi:hypothetical protein
MIANGMAKSKYVNAPVHVITLPSSGAEIAGDVTTTAIATNANRQACCLTADTRPADNISVAERRLQSPESDNANPLRISYCRSGSGTEQLKPCLQ